MKYFEFNSSLISGNIFIPLNKLPNFANSEIFLNPSWASYIDEMISRKQLQGPFLKDLVMRLHWPEYLSIFHNRNDIK